VQTPEGFNANEFMVNIGLVFKELLVEKEGANFSLVNFNALPEVYIPPRFSIVRVLIPVVTVIGLGLIIFAVILILNNRAEIAALRSQVTVAETSVTQLQRDVVTLNAQTATAQATADELNTRLVTMERGRTSIYLDLQEIVNLAKEKVSLAAVSHGGSSISVSGSASSVGVIYRYARALRSSPRFSTVWVSSISGGEGAFSFVFSLTK
jgi:Tfp pilus assembly protein PilN